MEAALQSLRLKHLLHLACYKPTNRNQLLTSKLRPFFVLRCSSSASSPPSSAAALPGGLSRRQSSSASPTSTSDIRAIRAIRIKKMQELRSNGLDPYAYEWDRTHTAKQLQEIYRDLGNGEESTCEKDYVSIGGRIVARRAFGKLAFLTLRDDSGTIQCSSISFRRYCSSTTISTSSQITYYIRLGEIETARKLFDQMPCKTIVSWNTIISGYFRHNQPIEAQHLFDQMPERNTVSWNGLISGYVTNKMVKKAREIFDVMPDRDVISWTAMVRGYVDEGMVSEAEALFWQMPERNVVSWTVMLGGLIHDGRIDDARRLYHMMPVKDVVAKTSMIGGLCSEGQLDEARDLFDSMRQKNVVSWTAMISGYVDNGKVDIARKLFEVMPERNEVTWTAMLMGYTNCGRIEDAWELFEAMPSKSVVACNALIIGLGENGEVSKARKIFDTMREKDDGSWTAMIKIYERKAFELEALSLFRMMQSEGLRPHFPSLIIILSVCASLATLNHGKQVHAKLLRSQLNDDVYLLSVLITMYMKCGDLFSAKIVFDRFAGKDTVMWNSMITGYAQHGLGNEALQVFREMLSLGIAPDNVTFIGVLSACSYSGKVKEGKEIFKSMKSKYGIEPMTEHYACMVDLLGRAGQLEEAMDLINDMSVFADAIIWGSLMGACRNHMNSDLAEVAAKKLLLLEPHNAGPYVLLSNIYALKGRWADVAKLRKTMRSRKVTKSPGCSWIEVEKEVHMFTGGESKPHIEHKQIVKMLEKLGGVLREAGYNPDGSFTLHDVDDEEKEQSLRHHSEKLAVAYGLLKLPEGMPIRVMKNLRLYCEKERLLGDQFEHLKTLVDIGDIVGAKGSIKRTEKGELSVCVTSFSVLTKSLLPLPDKFHGLADIDKRYRQRYVDMIANPEVAVIFKKRAQIISEIRKTVETAGFVEVETPVLQGAAGGAEARPFITYHNSLGQDLYLRIATELHLKRMLVGGFEKVYEIGRIFRNEGISTRHNPEFTTIEMYEAYSDYENMMNMAEDIIISCSLAVNGKLILDYQGVEICLERPWRRETMHNLVKEVTGIDFNDFSDNLTAVKEVALRALDVDGDNKVTNTIEACPTIGHVLNEVFEIAVEPRLLQPTFVLDYPIEISPLAKPHRRRAGLTERFELFICGREMANAFSELTDPLDQRERLEEQVRQHNKKKTLISETIGSKDIKKSLDDDAYDVTLDEDFLTALEYGMPPASGMGLGIDRLVMLLTNSASIRDVIAFPVLKTQQLS